MEHKDLFEKFNWEINSGNVNELKDRPIYVLWSGGLDSTALLYCLCHVFPDVYITAVSINLKGAKSHKTDKKCRQELKRRFKKEGLKIVYQESTVDLNVGVGVFGGLEQPNMWLMSLCFMSYTDNNAAVCFGYIQNDIIWHYMEYFKKAFYNLNMVTGNTNVSLYLPLGQITKQEIIDYMKQYNLFDLCNYCEFTDEYDGKPCGQCKDCKEIEYYEFKHKEGETHKI